MEGAKSPAPLKPLVRPVNKGSVFNISTSKVHSKLFLVNGHLLGRFFDAQSLARLSCCSRHAFAIAESEWLWQQLYLGILTSHTSESSQDITVLNYPTQNDPRADHIKRNGYKWRRILEHHMHGVESIPRCSISREPYTKVCPLAVSVSKHQCSYTLSLTIAPYILSAGLPRSGSPFLAV